MIRLCRLNSDITSLRIKDVISSRLSRTFSSMVEKREVVHNSRLIISSLVAPPHPLMPPPSLVEVALLLRCAISEARSNSSGENVPLLKCRTFGVQAKLGFWCSVQNVQPLEGLKAAQSDHTLPPPTQSQQLFQSSHGTLTANHSIMNGKSCLNAMPAT